MLGALTINNKYMSKKIDLRLEAMRKYPAKIIEYRDYSDDMPLQCPVCGWKGTPKESGWINTDSHFALDVSCPDCEKMLLVASFPFV